MWRHRECPHCTGQKVPPRQGIRLHFVQGGCSIDRCSVFSVNWDVTMMLYTNAHDVCS